MYFTSISETVAITLGIGRNSGETMRIVSIDNQKGIYFMGFNDEEKSLNGFVDTSVPISNFAEKFLQLFYYSNSDFSWHIFLNHQNI